MLVMEQALTEEMPLATEKTQKTRDDVDEDDRRAYGKPEKQ